MIPIRKHIALGSLGSLLILGAIFLTHGPNAPFASEPPASQVGAVGAFPQAPKPETVAPAPVAPPESAQSRMLFDPREVASEVLREMQNVDSSVFDDSEWEDEDAVAEEEVEEQD